MKEKILHGCILILLFFALPAMAQTNVLQQKISISFRNEGIAKCFSQLQSKGGVTFFYNPADIKVLDKKYNADLNNKTVAEVLGYLLLNTGLEYEAVDGKKIVIRKIIVKQSTAPRKRTISGIVIDATKNNPVAHAEIMAQSTGSVATADESGRFYIDVKDTTDVLVVYYVGYATKMVKAGSSPVLSVLLKADSKTLAAVTVDARRRSNTEAMLLNDRKNSAMISDGISAQNIEKTASITTTQALQRVSGVTVTDDKYVAIRGLGDRSVIGQLNGIRLASSDPDRSAIPLDLVPAGLLDNITIYKTTTADKPADAAAGIVELKTKSVPDRQTLSITVQSGMNSQTGSYVNSFYNSDMGFLGQKVKGKGLTNDFQQLSSQYPNGLGDIQRTIANSRNDPKLLAEANRINKIMHGFDPVLTTKYKKAPLNQIYSITYGNSYTVFKKHQVGLIAGANYYNRTNDIHDGSLTQYSVYQGVLTGNSALYSPRVIPNYITPNNINLGKY